MRLLVYFQFQQIKEDEAKIQLASLWLEGTTLVWWERKLQKASKHIGNILSSWSNFVSSLRNSFYPLAYVKKK